MHLKGFIVVASIQLWRERQIDKKKERERKKLRQRERERSRREDNESRSFIPFTLPLMACINLDQDCVFIAVRGKVKGFL